MLKDAGAEIFDFTCLEMRLGPRFGAKTSNQGCWSDKFIPQQDDDIHITILGNILYDLLWTKEWFEFETIGENT